MDYNDIVGRKFGRLTVLSYEGIKVSGKEGHGRSCYRCICDCGKEVIVKRKYLLNGRRTSCCDCTKITHEGDEYRYFDINGDSFIFDAQDLNLVQGHRWRIDPYGYPVTRIEQKNYRLSRLILQPQNGLYVDHINGDTRDNRRENLRLASTVDNQRNMRIPTHNSTGFKGVTYVRAKGRYRAQISINDRTKHIGYFDTSEEAARAYDTAARFLFGEFACVNFPLPGEQGCLRNQPQRLAATA